MKLYLPTKRWVLLALMILSLAGVSTQEALAQSKTVSGVVKGEDGTGLPGVTILEKDVPANGTVTDADGKFTLELRNGNVIIVSFIGMKTQEVNVGSQTSVEVTLESDITQLSEVVVIGYGTVKKSDLTGSVVSMAGDELRKMPVATVTESLTGRIAGVQVLTTEGSPDADVRIRIRGGTSLSQSNDPLYIVDGFPINNISDISPSDIETMNVLKDASSTAIYGSRGANGVIIITTKGGNKDGKVSVSFNTFAGFKKIAKTLDVLPAEDYVKWQYENAVLDDDLPSYENYFGQYQDMDLYSGIKGNDWQRIIYGRTGKVLSNDLSVRGGTEKFNYSVNYARFEEKSIMVGSDYLRNNFTLKVNNKPNDVIDLGFSLRYSQTEINGGGANEQNEVSSADSRLKHSVTYSPIPLQGLTTDDTNDQIASYFINPLTATADNDRAQLKRNYNIGGSIGWKIIENLQLRVEGGLDTYGHNDNRFYGLSTYYVSNIPAAENQDQPAVTLRDRKEVRLRSTNTLSYDFKNILGTNHHLNLLVGHEALKTESGQMLAVVHGFPTLFTSEEAFKLTTQGVPQAIDNSLNADDKLLSFFSRAQYDFKGRYLFTGTYRADGSSKFLKNNRWGYFPSAAVAWKISEEGFMTNTAGWLNELKLRISYGEVGNNNIPNNQTLPVFSSSTNTWINGFDSYWSASNRMSNPDLMWETTVTRNIGLDFGLLKGKLTGTIEVYQNTTRDLLIEFPTPGTGYLAQFRNLGDTENKGLEGSLMYSVIDEENIRFSVSANASFNRNKIVSLGGLEYINGTSNWASTAIGPDYRVEAGLQPGLMYGYVNDGRYEVSDFEGYDPTNGWILSAGVADASAIVTDVAPGVMKLKDLDDDGIITSADKQVIGNANPKHIGGITVNGFAYGFDLVAAFSWSYGQDVYNANKVEYTTSTPQAQYRNLTTDMADGTRWTNIDPATGALVTDPTALAALNANTTMWSPYMDRYIFSDWAVEDASYLRLNTLTLGYTLPDALASKAKLKNVRFYATGYNVFVLTNYSGFDPEVSTRRSTPYTPNVDYSAYPKSRQFVFGLNFNF